MIGDPLVVLSTFLIAIFAIIIGWIAAIYVQNKRMTNSQLEKNSEKANQKTETRRVEMSKENMNKFLEFDKIEDDMVVQEKGNRFVMVLKCQGINYDLMSEPEMLAVEEGFGNFLNTLKYPIQLYVQARSLNLEEGINVYKTRINGLKDECDKFENSILQAKKAGKLNSRDRDTVEFELRKKRSLLEYGADIVNYIEKMSKNKNILQRKYYIVVSYHTSELGLATNFTKEEAHDLAYSELYTRCRSIANALTPCGIECSILESEELAELLYIAYNKDEADVFNLKKALENGFHRLYSTAEDVLKKKQDMIDKAVQEQAIAEAELALQTAIIKSREQNNGLTYEEQASDAAKAQAMQLILDNADQYTDDVIDGAIEDLNSQMHVPVLEPDELAKDEEEEETTEGNIIEDIMKNSEDESIIKSEDTNE